MSFGIALSGLNAAQTDLDVTSNNIANSATTGFKESTTNFSELFSSSLQGVSSLQAGNGVAVASIAQQFGQGDIQTTGNNLDLAINGGGFFAVSNGGAVQYTRAGTFSPDNSGFVVNTAGQRLQVYPPTGNGSYNTSTMTDLQMTSGQSAPVATTTATLNFNLPANATPPTTTTFDPADPTSYNNSTSLTVYDSLGAAHTGTIYFANTAPNTWNSYLYVDGAPVPAAVAPATTPAPQQLAFSNAGVLTTPAGGQFSYGTYTPATGAANLNINFNVAQATQYGSTFGTTSITQNGYTAGQLSGITVGATGVVQANYTNGQSKALGQVALVDFSNPQGLQSADNTNWTQTFASGQPVMGTAGSAGFGQLQSGAVEASNVDITQQLVNMIVAQRNYQSNAQMISTEKSITQTIIQMAQ